jgi:CelD/BcsL family acetyltransferase involved in cellulose biosynthesis
MSAPDRFELIEPAQAFGAMAPAWEELLAASAADTPFLTPAWLEAWWSAYGAGREPLLVFARRGSDLVGIFPLQLVMERWRGRLPLRTLRLFGDGTYDSDYLDFIVRRGEEEAVLPRFWSWLRSGGSPIRYEVAQWNEIPAASPSGAVVRRLIDRDGSLLEEQRIGCVVAALPGSYEEYVASLKPRMRTKVRSLRRALVEQHGAALVRCDEATLAPTLESLFRLHERRWATRGESGVFAAAEKRAFYHAMARAFLRRGQLDLTTLDADGVPVAHQCCIRHGDTSFLLQEGYDPDWDERGVGNALRAMTIEAMIQEGVRTYDFLAGVTSHKLSWGGTVKESVRMTLRGSGARAALASGITFLAAARARIRAALSRSGR